MRMESMNEAVLDRDRGQAICRSLRHAQRESVTRGKNAAAGASLEDAGPTATPRPEKRQPPEREHCDLSLTRE
jgi:hypothetical protein